MPDVSELRFTLDSDLLTWDDWIALEDAREAFQKGGARAIRDLLARFMLGADGQRMDQVEARALLGQLKVSDITTAMSALMAAQRKVIDDAIPPAGPGS